MTAVAKFESIAAELVRVSPTPKAAAFAEKIAAQVRAKGADWISANTNALHIYSSNDEQFFEVAANRLFFLERWQGALMGVSYSR